MSNISQEATSIIHREELDLLKRDKNLTLMEASKHQSLKRILNIKCWLRVWDKALDRGCAGTIAIQKLIRYLATPAFNDRCQYCTRSINPTVTCAEHLIIYASPSPFTLLNIFAWPSRTLKTQFLDFLKLFLTYCHSV